MFLVVELIFLVLIFHILFLFQHLIDQLVVLLVLHLLFVLVYVFFVVLHFRQPLLYQLFFVLFLFVLVFLTAGLAQLLAAFGQLLGRVELFAGGVAPLDLLGQSDLVVLGEQRVLADVGEIEPDEVFLVALNALLRQGAAPCPVLVDGVRLPCLTGAAHPPGPRSRPRRHRPCRMLSRGHDTDAAPVTNPSIRPSTDRLC